MTPTATPGGSSCLGFIGGARKGTHEGVPHAGHRPRSIRNTRSECQTAGAQRQSPAAAFVVADRQALGWFALAGGSTTSGLSLSVVAPRPRARSPLSRTRRAVVEMEVSASLYASLIRIWRGSAPKRTREDRCGAPMCSGKGTPVPQTRNVLRRCPPSRGTGTDVLGRAHERSSGAWSALAERQPGAGHETDRLRRTRGGRPRGRPSHRSYKSKPFSAWRRPSRPPPR